MYSSRVLKSFWVCLNQHNHFRLDWGYMPLSLLKVFYGRNMANSFFYFWRCFCAFGFASALTLISFNSYAGYSAFQTITPSSLVISPSISLEGLKSSTFLSDTKNLTATNDGSISESYQTNFIDHSCYELKQSFDYLFDSLYTLSSFNCEITNLKPEGFNISSSFSITNNLTSTVHSVSYTSFINGDSSCLNLTTSDFFTNSVFPDGSPALYPIDSSNVLTDYPNLISNRDHSCVYFIDQSVNKVITDPPVDLSKNPQGCFNQSGFISPPVGVSSLFFKNSALSLPSPLLCNTIFFDKDSDGVPDKDDKCPDQGKLVNGSVNERGCPIYLDRDGDGVPEHDGNGNSPDRCPHTPSLDISNVSDDGCNSSNPLVTFKKYYVTIANDSKGYNFYNLANKYSGFSRKETPATYTPNEEGVVYLKDVPIFVSQQSLNLPFVLNSLSNYSFRSGQLGDVIHLGLPDNLVTYINNSVGYPEHEIPLDKSYFTAYDGFSKSMINQQSFELAQLVLDDMIKFSKFNHSEFETSVKSVLDSQNLSHIQVSYISSSHAQLITDYDLCKSVEVPTQSMALKSYQSDGRQLGNTIMIGRLPLISYSEYNETKNLSLLMHEIKQTSSDSLPPSNIPLKNPKTGKNIYTNSECSDVKELLQCYFDGASIISENGFLSCANSPAEIGDFTIPAYKPDGSINPTFKTMLNNSSSIQKALTEEFYNTSSTKYPCPTYSIDLTAVGLGYTSITYHCYLFNQLKIPFDVLFYGIWSFVAIRVFLSA